MEQEEEHLFDFGEVEVEGGVDPCEDLRSADEVGGVHHPDVGRHRRRRRWIVGEEERKGGKRWSACSFFKFQIQNLVKRIIHIWAECLLAHQAQLEHGPGPPH